MVHVIYLPINDLLVIIEFKKKKKKLIFKVQLHMEKFSYNFESGFKAFVIKIMVDGCTLKSW